MIVYISKQRPSDASSGTCTLLHTQLHHLNSFLFFCFSLHFNNILLSFWCNIFVCFTLNTSLMKLRLWFTVYCHFATHFWLVSAWYALLCQKSIKLLFLKKNLTKKKLTSSINYCATLQAFETSSSFWFKQNLIFNASHSPLCSPHFWPFGTLIPFLLNLV